MEIKDQKFIGHGSGVDAKMGIRTGLTAGRRDGRSLLEMRPMVAALEWISQPDGSARLQLRQTDVAAAVYGPTECPMSKQDSERVHIHVTFRRRDAGPITETVATAREAVARNDITKLLQEVLLGIMHPRKAVIVNIHVLYDDGSVLAAAVNAAVLALLDAGVSMRHVPTAACVSTKNGALFVDPLRSEESEADGLFMFTFDTALNDNTGFMSVFTEGDCGGIEHFQAAENLCRQIAKKTYDVLLQSIDRKVKRSHTWSQN